MIIITDAKTGNVINLVGTNSAYPDGNIPGLKSKKGQKIVKLHDNSDLAKKIMSARYKFKLNDDCTDIIDIETEKEKTEKAKKLEAEKDKFELKKMDSQLAEILVDIIETNNLKVSDINETLLNKMKFLLKKIKGEM